MWLSLKWMRLFCKKLLSVSVLESSALRWTEPRICHSVWKTVHSWTVFWLEATLQSPLLLANISLSCPVWNTPVTSKSASYSLLLCLFVLSLLLCWKAGKWNPLHVSFSFFKFTRRKIYSVQYCCCGVFFPICNFCFVFLSIMYVYVFKWRISLKAFSHLAYVLSNTILSHFCL